MAVSKAEESSQGPFPELELELGVEVCVVA